MNSRWIGPALAALLLSLGCAQTDKCPPGSGCGGDLVGAADSDGDGFNDKTWTINGSCLNDVVVVPQNATLINAAVTVDGQPPPEAELNHWCSEMVIAADKSIKKISPWFPAIPIRDGSIQYSAKGDFILLINYFEPQIVEFQRGCFESQGFFIVPEGTATNYASFTCSEFGAQLKERLKQEPNIENESIGCTDDSSGEGCVCGYNLLMVTGAKGTFTMKGTTVNHYDHTTKQPVSIADYCSKDGTLTLYGHNNNYLLNQPAIRTLSFSE
jgi:hypothetical protein